MLKYVDTAVTLSEIPDEITLCINISNCPCHCKGCHSTYLAEDIGDFLDLGALTRLIDRNEGVTCVSFMGGDSDPRSVNMLAGVIKTKDLKTAWYSGRQELAEGINLRNFDYIKLGPYIEEKGPLNNPNTNQRLYKYDSFYSNYTIGWGWRDITSKFWNGK